MSNIVTTKSSIIDNYCRDSRFYLLGVPEKGAHLSHLVAFFQHAFVMSHCTYWLSPHGVSALVESRYLLLKAPTRYSRYMLLPSQQELWAVQKCRKPWGYPTCNFAKMMLKTIRFGAFHHGSPPKNQAQKLTNSVFLGGDSITNLDQAQSLAKEMAESGVTPALEERLKELRRPFRRPPMVINCATQKMGYLNPVKAAHECLITYMSVIFTHGT